MRGNDTVTLMYASKARSLANAYKKWKGEMIGLKLNDAVTKKQTYESKFQQWANTHEGKNYRNLLKDMEAAYTEYKAYSELVDYTSEAFFAVELLNFASGYKKIAALTASDTISTEFYQQEAANFYTNSLNFYSKYYVKIDKELFATMMKLYAENVAPA